MKCRRGLKRKKSHQLKESEKPYEEGSSGSDFHKRAGFGMPVNKGQINIATREFPSRVWACRQTSPTKVSEAIKYWNYYYMNEILK